MNLHQEFQPQRLLSTLTSGLVIGIMVVLIEISFAALIFSGPLARHVSSGIGLALFGAVVMLSVVALTSSLDGAIASPQDSPAAILALVAAAIAESVPASAGANTAFYTVLAAIAASSFLTGLFFLFLGRFKLGSLTHFVPYPVIGGFLAGVGWLLVQGAFGVMADTSIGMEHLARLVQYEVMAQWLPGLAFAVLLLVIMRRYSYVWIMPAMMLAAVFVFYLFLGLTRTPLAVAGSRGWLLGPFPQGALWQPLTPAMLAQVDWPLVVQQLDRIGTILVISMIGMLLNCSGLELQLRRDIDLNRELEAAGVSNLIAALGGGSVGYQTLSFSVLANRMGGGSRLAGLFAAALCGVVLLFGASLLSFFPKWVVGGLLLFLGLTFLADWVYDGWFKLSRTDYALVLVILVIVGTAGFLPGVAVGLGIAIVLFVVNYSRVNVVKHTLSGANFHSTVDRPASQRDFLRAHGGQIEILQLQGYIFFGTAQNLLDQVRKRTGDSQRPRLTFLILDLSRLSGLDSSAVSSFARLRQLAEAKQLKLLLTDLTPGEQRQLEKGGLGKADEKVLHVMRTLDHGMEWCENQILAAEGKLLGMPQDTLTGQLAQIFTGPEQIDRFMGYLEEHQVPAGTCLIHQGDASDSLYFMDSGQATVDLQLPDGRNVRLRKMHAGTIIGEVGLYMGGVRTASVMTTEPSVLYYLSASAIRRMEEQEPELAAALHKWIARLIAERLTDYNNLLSAVIE